MNVLIVSDIHANLVAFEAVLRACPAPGAIWNLGDAVGYGPRPAECVDLLMERGAAPSLVGNHDLACIGELDLAEFNPVARAAAEWTTGKLGPSQLAYLAALRPSGTAEGYELAHGSPNDPIWEYVTDRWSATANLRRVAGACFVGHTHVAMVAVLRPGAATAAVERFPGGESVALAGARYLVNPGSVGQPRDGDPRAAYAVLDTQRATVTAHRVAYDIEATQRQMREEGWPHSLIDRLSVGR